MLSLVSSLLKCSLVRDPMTRCPVAGAMLHTSAVLDKARKGTRERKRKQALANKKKKEERLRKNPPPIPYKVELMLKSKGLWGPPKPVREKDDQLSFTGDSVYLIEDFAWKRWHFSEAIDQLRLLFHPTMMNRAHDLVHVKIEFNLKASKKGKFLDGFSKMVPILHSYERNVPDRKVLFFVPNEQLEKEALDNGAVMAGGTDLVLEISKGRVDLAEVDFFLCHPEMLGNLRPLVGILREKMPRVQDGTVGDNVSLMVKTFGKGIAVDVSKVEPVQGIADEPDYGFCITTIGRLDMGESQLRANLDALLETLRENRPKRKEADSSFLTRCLVFLKPAVERPSDKFLMFSIQHPLVDDARVEEQERVLPLEAAKIACRLQQLRGQPHLAMTSD